MRNFAWRICLAAGFIWTSAAPGVAASDLQTRLAANTGWSAFGGLASGGQYSALDQIDRSNVARLQRAWVARTGDVAKGAAADGGSSFQATPVLWNETLYVCTPMNRVLALDAATGEERWAFDGYDILPEDAPVFAANCRGVALWTPEGAATAEAPCSARVFKGDIFGNLVAIDAKTGALCADFGDSGAIDFNARENYGRGGLFFTSPPTVVGDVVILGSGVGDNMYTDAADGIVRAIDARTGADLWAFNPIPPEVSDRTGGANVWSMTSADAEAGLVFLPTSSPSVDPYGGNRLDPIAYANAVVALDIETGAVAWSRQLVHHDIFDYDLPAQPILVDLETPAGPFPALVQITKMGFVFIFNRLTGEPLFEIVERPAPASDVPGERAAPTQPAPVAPPPFARQGVDEKEIWGLTFWDRGWCRKRAAELRNDGLFTPPSLKGSLSRPSALGGGNWGGAAVDAQRGVLFVKTQNLATILKLAPADPGEERPLGPPVEFLKKPLNGAPYSLDGAFFVSPWGLPCVAPPWGEIVAIDLAAGVELWRRPLGRIEVGPFRTPAAWGSPNVGGPIATAGGLVFIGAGMDGSFRALDWETGDVVWSDERLPAPAMAAPMTYEVGGVQYVAVAAGGNGLAGTRQSDAIVAYRLPAD